MKIVRPVLLYNPNAGKGATRGPLVISNPLMAEPGDPLDAFRAYLRTELGQDIPELTVETLEETTRMARQAVADGANLILAAGGDGTLRAVADALIGTDATLGILPRGTVNVFARELGIPLDNPQRAVEIVLHGVTTQLDVGRVGGVHHFLLMCSAGIDAHAVASVNPDLKNLVGSSAYILSGLASLASYSPVRVTITADDFPPEEYEAFSVVIANAASYAGDFMIAPEADLEDGMLDVCIFNAPPGLPPVQSAAFLRQVAAFMTGRVDTDPDVRFFRTQRIAIETQPSTPVQIDGDAFGTTPLIVEIVPKALQVRVPISLLAPDQLT